MSTAERMAPSQLDPETAGARWLRCDLHVHTPLDPSRTFGEDVQTALRKDDAGDSHLLRAIAFRLFDACRHAGLRLIAITDHNEVQGYARLAPFLDEWKAARGAELTVLPGVEVTVGGERMLHILLVAQEGTPASWLTEFLAILFDGKDRFNASNQPLSCGRSLSDFLQTTRRCFEHKSYHYLLVPAHINRDCGTNRELRASTSAWDQELQGLVRQQAFAHEDWAAFQVRGDPAGVPGLEGLLHRWAAAVSYQRPFEQLQTDEQRRLRQRRDWPLIEASDPKQYTDIGSAFSYLKMEIPSLEGVRLALLDPASRLRRREDGAPAIEHSVITAVRVRRTDFLEALDVGLSPNLNVVIGGRGTGKSTLLELIRYGLDRARPDDFAEQEDGIRRQVERILQVKGARDLGQTAGMLLPDHRVEIDLVVAGRPYTVQHDAQGIRVLDDDSEGLDVRGLISPRILSQRQIAQIGQDRSAQRRELDALADPAVDDEQRRQRRVIIEELLRLQGQRTELSRRQTTLGAQETKLRRVGDQIRLIEGSASRELLERYRGIEAEGRWLDDVLDALARAADEVDNARDGLAAEAPATPPDGPSREWTSQVAARVIAALTAGQDRLHQVARDLRQGADQAVAERNGLWQPEVHEARQRYAELAQRLAADGASFESHQPLLQQRALLERDVARLRRLPAEIARLETLVAAARERLVVWHRERVARRRETAAALALQDADLRMLIEPFADRDDLLRRRSEWFGGSGLQERDWEVLVDYVYDGGMDQVPQRLSALAAALRMDAERSTRQANLAESPGLEVRGLLGSRWGQLTGHFLRALERLDRRRLDEVERFLPEDQVQTRVRDAQGQFKPIEQGSLGQRSTAVLSLLLAAQQEPLIVDQPEEDLDNAYVYDVIVDLLRKRKFHRQFILATHNANIPVNGDAELIVTLGVEQGLGVVEAAGSIDNPLVKDQVSSVMEGSVEAFRLRRQRYGF